jgi:hypothetical protein
MFKENPTHRSIREVFGSFGDKEILNTKEIEMVKYEIVVTPSLDVMVDKLAEEKGVEKPEIIKDAIETYIFDLGEKEKDSVNTQGGGIVWKIKLLFENLRGK